MNFFMIILYVLFISASGITQVRILELLETGRQMKLLLQVEPFSESELLNYFNEDNPEEFAIPSRNVIIGMPYTKVLSIQSFIKNKVSRKFKPNINPVVVKRDSLLNYYAGKSVRPGDKSEIVELEGFLWYENIYCVSLRINHCSFDDLHKEMTDITEIEVVITLDDEITEADNKFTLFDENHFIINYPEASRYTIENPYENMETTAGWIDYNKRYIKLKTAADGIYRITYEQLKAYNIQDINPSSLNIYKNGSSEPIYVYGEQDFRFDPGDYIEFYGMRNMGNNHRLVSEYSTPYNEYIDRYSDTTVYWLTWDDTISHRVRSINTASLNAYDTVHYYNEIVHLEKDNWFDFSTDELVRREFPFWIENKTWGWHSLRTGSANYDFYADDIVKGREVNIFSKLQGYASSLGEYSHLIGLGLNESVINPVYLKKNEQKVLNRTISSDSLFNGKNSLKLISLPTASDINTVFVDWLEIEYPRYLRLKEKYLLFSFKLADPGIKAVHIKGAMSDNYVVWKSGWNSSVRYSDLLPVNNSIIFSDTINKDDKFCIISREGYLNPVIEPPLKFKNLRDQSNRADYLILTNTTFLNTALVYSSFIENTYNITAQVVNVEDIYNEFSYGFFNPEAIKEFLKYSYYNWEKPSPQYVFIVGDGTYDYHRNKEKNLGSPAVNNIVPSFGAPVSDNWFVIWDTTGAYIPMMNIGRIPVNTDEEFYFYMHKHKNYLSECNDDWNKRYLFFSGGLGNNQEELDQFKRVNEIILASYVREVPVGGRGIHFYKTASPQTNFGPFTNEEITNAIDSSGLFISYIGHSGTQTWDNGIVDPSQLSNKRKRHPLITDFGCSTGKFAEPDVISFSEMFINKGDAIVYLGNSSLGFHSTSAVYPQLFYKKILRDSVYRISEAHRRAKTDLLKQYGASSVYRLFALTNTFFGDPIISLPIPVKPDLVVNNTSLVLPAGLSAYSMDELPLVLTYYNYGKVQGDSFYISIKDYCNDEVNYEERIVAVLPFFESSYKFNIPVKGKPGQHKLVISADPDNLVEEIFESNNEVSLDYFIPDSDLRLLFDYPVEGSIKDSVEIMLPAYKSGDKYIIETSFNKDFSDPVYYSCEGDFTTKIRINNSPANPRIWLRGKREGSDSYSFNRTFFIDPDYSCMYADSLSFEQVQKENVIVSAFGLSADSSKTIFSVISAGFNDGKTAVISKNGQTYVPGGNTIGHHVCVFREDTHEFVDYRRFNLFSGTPSEGEEYYKFLDTLSSDYLLLIGVNDEGRVPDSLKRKLHEFGSIYIDSLKFRSSWAFIGRKGSPRGSVPEMYSHPFEGKAIIDTMIIKPSLYGRFTTPRIGPSGRWEKIRIISSTYDSSAVKLALRAHSKDYKTDSLICYINSNSDLDIGFINAEIFPFISVQGEVHNSEGESPYIKNISMGYKFLSDIVISERGTRLEKDTLESGEELTLELRIYNAGEMSTGEFNIALEVSNGIVRDTLLYIPAACVYPKQTTAHKIVLRGLNAGSKTLKIYADYKNDVYEIYEDNNIVLVPFYVKKDINAPEIKIYCNGAEVFDGSYIEQNGVITVTASDNSYLDENDTSFIKIWIDNKLTFLSGGGIRCTAGKISADCFSDLPPGEHTIKAAAVDKQGNLSEAEVKVLVSGETKLLSVYNYPNPFSKETWFTFLLTGVPDDMTISIYSAAGRLIKKIMLDRTELKADFNRIYWDGRDDEGDILANGVYLYKLTLRSGEKKSSVIQKLAVIR